VIFRLIPSRSVQPQPGTTLQSSVRDLGTGSYEVDICWDPDSVDAPGVGITQPERPTVVVRPSDGRRFVYSVKFLCGEQEDGCRGCGAMRPGKYATEINIHNFHERDVRIGKRVLPLILSGVVRGREPNFTGAGAVDKIVLPAHSATMDDCCRILELLLGAKPAAEGPLTGGFLEIVSPVELSVTAVYTVTDPLNGSTSMDIENVQPKRGG
jgi:hypothetical protein